MNTRYKVLMILILFFFILNSSQNNLVDFKKLNDRLKKLVEK